MTVTDLEPRVSVQGLGDAPERIIDLPIADIYSIPLAEQHAIQLRGARARFEQLRPASPC